MLDACGKRAPLRAPIDPLQIAAYLAVLDGLRRRSTVKVDSGGPDTEKLQLHWKSRGANSEHLRFGQLPILQSL